MELGNYMTATEFAEKINTPYPTVAAWLREGRVPGAEMREVGNLKFWLIPVDVLRDFTRPKKGRPALIDVEQAKRAKKKVAGKSAILPFEPPATTAKPEAGKSAKNSAKKMRKRGNH